VNRRTFLSALAATPFFAAGVHAAPAKRASLSGDTGFASVPGGKVWWQRVGDGKKTPLLLLHGGPGMGHDYLLPLAALAEDRAVIFYDQLGCGRSNIPADTSLYTIEHFAAEVDAVRRELGLDRIVLYGHSWGGALAVEYMTSTPRAGVEKLILAGGFAGTKQANAEMEKLVRKLPEGETLLALDRAGETGDPQYLRLSGLFNSTYFCRVPLTPEAEVSMKYGTASPTAAVLIGNGLMIAGNLKDWNRIKDLDAIPCPTLITTGEFDEVGLACQKTLHEGIGNADLIVMKGCSHMTMTEQPEAYNRILRDFIA
jgi:proline iminopeptidase